MLVLSSLTFRKCGMFKYNLKGSILHNLGRAAVLIAYDNGMINRHTFQDVVINEMLHSASKTGENLYAVDSFLGELSDEELETLCCGEQGVVSCPENVDIVLNAMFEGE